MSKFRSVLSQLRCIFPYIFLQFALGSFNGIQVIIIAELHKENSEIPATLEELSWYASLDIIRVVGSLITGLLTHRFGCRPVAFTAALMYITTLLLYYFSTTVTVLLISRTISSLLTVFPLVCSYVSEISEPHLRGPFLAISGLADNSGFFFSLLLGSLIYWRTIALVNLTFPIVAIMTVLATPNSPTWLASKGRLTEAEKSLCQLRGWVDPIDVQNELHILAENVEKSTLDSHIKTNTWHERTKYFFQLFLQRSFYLPLGTIFIMFLVVNLCGLEASENYSTIIFRELNSPIEESVATAIMGAMAIFGQLIILFLIQRVGKRKLVFFSVVVVGLCQASVAIVGFFELKKEFLWVPPIAIIIANLADASGAGPLVYMLNSEIFPSSVRYVGTSIGFAISMIMRATVNKLFLYIVNAITMPGIFLLFALMNVVALFTHYFLFPETEGKSLKDIEDHYEGVRSLQKSDTL